VLRDLHGTAARTVTAPLPECFALLAAVEGYPDWYPDVVRQVDVLERDAAGQPRRARAQLHVAWGPVVKDFDLVLAVVVDPPSVVRLTRVSDQPSSSTFEVGWQLREDAGTRIDVDLRAALDVPRFLPLGGIGVAVAGGFVDAAARRLGAA
jgi:ribosome-associated toxin RatA of RatAB toxin-antitoxin module